MKFLEALRESQLIPGITFTYILISILNEKVIERVAWLKSFHTLAMLISVVLLGIEGYFTFKDLKKIENEELDDLL